MNRLAKMMNGAESDGRTTYRLANSLLVLRSPARHTYTHTPETAHTWEKESLQRRRFMACATKGEERSRGTSFHLYLFRLDTKRLRDLERNFAFWIIRKGGKEACAF
jgi:hypothetical protein